MTICARPGCGQTFDSPNVNRKHCSESCRWMTIAAANLKYRERDATTQRRNRHAKEIAAAGFEVSPELIALCENCWQRGRQARRAKPPIEKAS
jgi:hypothetical protein